MRFTAKTADIRKLFEGALPFSAKRNALSVTGCFKLDAADGRLTLMACDSAKAIETSIPVEVEIPGCAVADSSKLKDILKAAKEYDEIVFEMASDGKLEISNAGEQRFMMKLKTIPADRFPTLDKPKDVLWFSISQDDLLTMADKTTFMVGKDPSRIALTGCPGFHVLHLDFPTSDGQSCRLRSSTLSKVCSMETARLNLQSIMADFT